MSRSWLLTRCLLSCLESCLLDDLEECLRDDEEESKDMSDELEGIVYRITGYGLGVRLVLI